MPRKERFYNWFVEPLQDASFANKVIAGALGEEEDNPINLCAGVWCGDGKKHNLWNCPHQIAHALWNSRSSLHISIRIWCRENNGPIKPSFLFSMGRRGVKKNNERKVA